MPSSSDRFWNQVLIVEVNKCWEWLGRLNQFGYGKIYHNRKQYLAHRFSFLLHHKREPVDCVLHKCDNRKCVNPHHLFEGTQGDNNRDMAAKQRAARLNGIANPNAKLTTQQLHEITHWFQVGMTRMEVARHFKISWPWADSLKRKIDRGLSLV